MNVTLCSAFRNAESYIDRYTNQVFALAQRLRQGRRGYRLHAIWCEGDSTDDTYELLKYELYEREEGYSPYSLDIFQHHHGGPDHGSVVNAERFANIAKVCNAIWQRIPQDADAVIWVESDLIWEPATMLALLDDLATYPAVSPMVMLEREGWPPNLFYDVWAGRKDGEHISHHAPYFAGWDRQTPLQVDSMGSCLGMRGDLARQLHWPPEDVVVGLCRLIYERGGSVWLDPKVSVIHE